MAGIYKVTASVADKDGNIKELKFEFNSKKVAVDVRSQLNNAGFDAKAELTKVLDWYGS